MKSLRCNRQVAKSWRRGVFLGVIILLMSLCHLGVSAMAAAPELPGTQALASTGSEDGASHSTSCVSRAKAITPLAKRINIPGNAQPIVEFPLWLAARGAGSSAGFTIVALPSSGELRALLQVFRI